MLKNRIQACRTRHVSRGKKSGQRREEETVERKKGDRRERRVVRETGERDSEEREREARGSLVGFNLALFLLFFQAAQTSWRHSFSATNKNGKFA